MASRESVYGISRFAAAWQSKRRALCIPPKNFHFFGLIEDSFRTQKAPEPMFKIGLGAILFSFFYFTLCSEITFLVSVNTTRTESFSKR